MDGVYTLRNAASGLVLATEGGRSGSGARLRLVPESETEQRWQVVPVHPGAGMFHIVHPDSGKRFDVAGASTEGGARVQLWSANGYGAQEWLVEEHVDQPGVVTLVACISGLPLDVDEEGRARQWEETDSPTQGWRLERAAGRGK
ncbi:RICIN domain-containing protein [Streptomyces bambusae]|uniref:RICIN domain-containing protein n=1 Tax=Streptomyces bambusae TaxID=1550616 RepID=UPI001CFCFD43|nr:RICIN domain-containing protein [Streptomyces bambusae]MCB5166457.1 RICIN domain-containing protein [Streptomyces bambusae]